MCRMVGVVFRHEFPMETLLDLRKVAEVGLHQDGSPPGHGDGWGIVSFRGGSPRYIGRSCRPMFIDNSFDSALEDVKKTGPPNVLIAHARALSTGAATIPNTHPFIIDGLVLCHNGTVRNIKFEPRHPSRGETDTERLLARLADRVEDSGDLERSIKELILKDIHSHEYTAAIMFISDGRRMFAYRDVGPWNSEAYYDLKMAIRPDCVIFFQETQVNLAGEVSQIRNGELVVVDLDLNIRREMIC